MFTPRNLQLYWNLLPLSSKSACNVSGLGRSPGEGNGNPYQYSCLENSMDRGAWWAAVHGVAKSQILHFSSKNVLTFNLLVLLLDLQRRDKMQKQKKKYISIYKSCLHLLSILSQVWPTHLFSSGILQLPTWNTSFKKLARRKVHIGAQLRVLSIHIHVVPLRLGKRHWQHPRSLHAF